MTTVARTTGATLIALLGTVGSAAGMVAKTVDAAASSVDMLDTYVQRAKRQQTRRHLIEDDKWEEMLVLENAAEHVKAKRKILDQFAGDEEDRRLFNETYARYQALLDAPTP